MKISEFNLIIESSKNGNKLNLYKKFSSNISLEELRI